MAETIKVFIEIPEGSTIKYERDEETGEIVVDRINPTSFRWPVNYGSIQNTLGDDGDPLDAIVFMSQTPVPGVVIKCTVIGMLEMEDEGGVDHKLICVPLAKVDHLCGKWESLADVPEHRTAQIRHFFEHYKDLEPEKWVKLNDWKDAAAALEILHAAQAAHS